MRSPVFVFMETKKCCSCKVAKIKSDFYKNKAKMDGLSTECILCTKNKAKKYYQINSKKIIEKVKDYAQKNIEVKKEYLQNYFIENKEQSYSRKKEWNANNPERAREISIKMLKKRREILSDVYIKDILKQQGIPKESISDYPVLIELKRAQILNKRVIKSKL